MAWQSSNDGSGAGEKKADENSQETAETRLSYREGKLIWPSYPPSLSSLPPGFDASTLPLDVVADDDVVLVEEHHDERKRSDSDIGIDFFHLPPALPPSNGASWLHQSHTLSLPPAYVERHRRKPHPLYLTSQHAQLHVLISIKSGTGLAEAFYERVLKRILEHVGLTEGTDYTVSRTANAESVKQYAQTVLLSGANAGREQTLVLLSGDGGLVDLINGLASGEREKAYRKPTVVLLPLGTGNALFHSLNRIPPAPLPANPLAAGLRLLLAGKPQPLPMYRALFSPGAELIENSDDNATRTPIEEARLYGCVVASYGFHATLVADSDTVEWRKHGSARFGMVANELLNPKDGGLPHAYKAKVTWIFQNGRESEEQRQEHGYLTTIMVSNLERTFTISPDSRPLDGQLRCVHFGNLSGKGIMDIMMQAYDGGKHVGESNKGVVGYETIDGMRIDFLEEEDTWRRVCIDGSIVQIPKGGWMEVRKVEAGKEAVDVVAWPQ